MEEQDVDRFTESLAAARAAFGLPEDAAVAVIYFRALQPFDIEDVLAALNNKVATADRMPPPGPIAADLRDIRKRRHLEAQTAKYLAEPSRPAALPAPKRPAAPPPTRRRRAERRETEEQARQRLAAQAGELGITREQIDAAMENAR